MREPASTAARGLIFKDGLNSMTASLAEADLSFLHDI
jgi:hypothetical protein